MLMMGGGMLILTFLFMVVIRNTEHIKSNKEHLKEHDALHSPDCYRNKP